MDKEQRENLDKILHQNGGDDWWHADLFEKNTKNILPKDLEILANLPSEDRNYNCFIYALGLEEDQEILQDSHGFIYDTFFQKLIDKKIVEFTDSPQPGDYVLYRNSEKYPNEITHIGVIERESKIVSKWAWGPLLRHSLLDVPASYGDEISYVKRISKERAKDLYYQFKEFNKKSELK